MRIDGDEHLRNMRNVFQSPHDVEQLLTSGLDQITVLSLGLGTSCLVGATVSLPPGHMPATLQWGPDGKKKNKNKKMRCGKCKSGMRKRRMAAVKAQQQAKWHKETKYFDLVVKCKAVSQAMDSFINWQQEQKK
ncbi:hypothetical protein BG006_004064, partial [Podila minutissima]